MIEIVPLTSLPEIAPGDDLVALLTGALERAGLTLRGGDCLVVTQKIVSWGYLDWTGTCLFARIWTEQWLATGIFWRLGMDRRMY